MSAAFKHYREYSIIACCQCGMTFGLDSSFEDILRRDKKTFYCPNGHSQGFYGNNEADRLKKELEQEQKRRGWAESTRDAAIKRRDHMERRARAYRGILTKTKNRIKHGVCPCCNRTFKNMADHMKTKHPSYIRQGSKK